MEREPKWTAVLRCYRCQEKFLVSHVVLEHIKMLPGISRCSACGAEPMLRRGGEFNVHRLVDFTDAMETVYRRRPDLRTWHFVPECRSWPRDQFIELNMRPLADLCDECYALAHQPRPSRPTTSNSFKSI
ncbi:MAG TPA: hypothetical protein VKH64_13425 [Candidatus Binatia bacterium]|nr:hypothetical protein [Candidatus Binatia bacterium]